MDRFIRVTRSWLHALRNRIPVFGESDPFNLRSSDALRDPEVQAALEKWKKGDLSTPEFRKWLDEKWEKDQE